MDSALIHPKEKALKPLVMVVSILMWALVVCSLVGLCYGLVFFPFLLMAHAFFLGHIRGTGVRVDAAQLPDLHRRVVAASEKLKLPSVPEVYVLQSGGALNAFATKLFSRSYVVLYSDLIDKCNSDKEIDFVVAHELAHHAAGHLKTMLLTAPANLIPLLGPAYSRAKEYTCDRAALSVVGSLEASQRALAVLAAGSKAGAQLDLRSLSLQQANAGDFWPAVAELSSSHPFLPKRAAMLATWEAERNGSPQLIPAAPARPLFAHVVALFFGRQALVLVAVGYLLVVVAAVALPNLAKLREHAEGIAPPLPGLVSPPPAQPETEDEGDSAPSEEATDDGDEPNNDEDAAPAAEPPAEGDAPRHAEPPTKTPRR